MSKNEKKRQRNYRLLREAGYNSFEANKYKDYSQKKVQKLLKVKEVEKQLIKEALGGN